MKKQSLSTVYSLYLIMDGSPFRKATKTITIRGKINNQLSDEPIPASVSIKNTKKGVCSR